MRSKKKRARQRRQALVASGLATAGALVGGGMLHRRSRHRTTDGPADATPERDADTRREWQCECGQALLITGEGRHRVFWRLEAPLDDPLLDDGCPRCERALSPQA